MCQNKVIDYNIMVKSKYTDLFILKKENFLKISITYKEIIQQFLQNSLNNYLFFLDQKQELEDKICEKLTIRNQSMLDYEALVDVNTRNLNFNSQASLQHNPSFNRINKLQQIPQVEENNNENDSENNNFTSNENNLNSGSEENVNHNQAYSVSILDSNMKKLIKAIKENSFLFKDILERINPLIRQYKTSNSDYEKRNCFEELQDIIQQHLKEVDLENNEPKSEESNEE